MIEKLLSFLIFLTILLSPLYVIRWTYFGVLPTTLLELLILVTAGVWIISKIVSRDFSWPRTPFDTPILFFLGAAVISLFITPDLRGGLGAFKAYIVEPILFFYVLIDVYKNSKLRTPACRQARQSSKFSLIVSALLLAAFWVSILGILQALFGIGVITPHEAAVGRAHAVFNSGNALALFVGPVFVLGLGCVNKLGKLGKLGLGVMFVTLFLTKSTGALVGLGTIFVVWLFFKFLGRERGLMILKIAAVLSSIIGTLFFFNVSRFVPSVENPWQRSGGTTQIRLCLWEGARNLLLDRPIWGAGLSGFKEVYSQKYYTCDAEALEYPHNWVLNFWAEMGILGLIAFLWILFVFFKLLVKQLVIKKSQIAKPLAPRGRLGTNSKSKIQNRKYLEIGVCNLELSISGAMLYWLIHGLVDVFYFKNDLALEFWILVGLFTLVLETESEKGE